MSTNLGTHQIPELHLEYTTSTAVPPQTGLRPTPRNK